ncbi:MAG: hypothetical protein GFGODING_02303 [Flavobacteriales bacterium]|nr:hypothetical protein [Flavobacteriales bacterium]
MQEATFGEHTVAHTQLPAFAFDVQTRSGLAGHAAGAVVIEVAVVHRQAGQRGPGEALAAVPIEPAVQHAVVEKHGAFARRGAAVGRVDAHMEVGVHGGKGYQRIRVGAMEHEPVPAEVMCSHVVDLTVAGLIEHDAIVPRLDPVDRTPATKERPIDVPVQFQVAHGDGIAVVKGEHGTHIGVQ